MGNTIIRVCSQPAEQSRSHPRGRQVLWNGNPVNTEQLEQYSALVASLTPQSFTILEIDSDVDCERVKVVRRMIDEKAKCRSGGLCGEGSGQWTTTYNPRQR